MSSGEVWTAQNNIVPSSQNIPVFFSYFKRKTFNNFKYIQKMELGTKIYYLQMEGPTHGIYKREDNSTGTFKFIQGILTFKNSSNVEVEKLSNNQESIRDYVIDHF